VLQPQFRAASSPEGGHVTPGEPLPSQAVCGQQTSCLESTSQSGQVLAANRSMDVTGLRTSRQQVEHAEVEAAQFHGSMPSILLDGAFLVDQH
jgi:hypothetical protein